MAPSRTKPPRRHRRRLPLAERIDRWRERNSVLAILFLVSSLITAVSVLTLATLNVYDRYRRHFEWRAIEYRKLASLRAGFQISKFQQVLGPPVFVDRIGKRTTNTFRGRDYWVQAMTRGEGKVIEYAVTSCDKRFRPTFSLYPSSSVRVTLQRSTLAEVREALTKEVGINDLVIVRYVNGAHTAPFYDTFDGANPFGYKTFAWGFDDSCPPAPDAALRSLYGANLSEFNNYLSRGPTVLKRAETSVVVNTYAETAPTIELRTFDVTEFAIHPQIAALLPP
jgi:hypothetical protein